MVQVICLVLSLVPFILIKHVQSQGYVGDFCTLQSSGAAGQCQLISNCPAAIQALQTQGIPPQTCGFDGSVPIVCCVGGGSGPQLPPTQRPTPRPTPKPTPKPTPRPTASTAPPTPKITRVGQKSELKCREYQRYGHLSKMETTLSLSDEDVCSIDSTISLIIGDDRARPKEFPHMASIGYEDERGAKSWLCAGSLISERFVLTAAHCLHSRLHGEPKYVRLGVLDLKNGNNHPEGQEIFIDEVFSHPNFKQPSIYNDIGLLKLKTSAKLNHYATPACLNIKPTPNVPNAVVTGWGTVDFTDYGSDHLTKTVLQYSTHEECNNTYKQFVRKRLQYGILDESQICARSPTISKDVSCPGDTGGPLQTFEKDECIYYIVGVTSFGRSCALANTLGVYTRVSHYIGWIEGIVWH